MRAVIIVVLLSLSSVVTADESPPIRGNEVIVIEGAPPVPKVKAKPKKRYLGTGSHLDNDLLRPAPDYSDRAIESDTWSVAWMLLDINDKGRVERVKFLRYPGQDLEKIAVRTALKLQFEPAIAHDGKPIRSYVVWPIEWPSYGWLVYRTGLATGIPDTSRIPCRGSGPLHMDSKHPVYKDCSAPDWDKANTEPWQTR